MNLIFFGTHEFFVRYKNQFKSTKAIGYRYAPKKLRSCMHTAVVLAHPVYSRDRLHFSALNSSTSLVYQIFIDEFIRCELLQLTQILSAADAVHRHHAGSNVRR